MTHPTFQRLTDLLAPLGFERFTDLFIVFGTIYDDERTRETIVDVMATHHGRDVTPEYMTAATWGHLTGSDTLRDDYVNRTEQALGKPAYKTMHDVFTAIRQNLGTAGAPAQILHLTASGLQPNPGHLRADVRTIRETNHYTTDTAAGAFTGTARQVAEQFQRASTNAPLHAALAAKYTRLAQDDALSERRHQAFLTFVHTGGYGPDLPGTPLRLLADYHGQHLHAYDPAQPDLPGVYYSHSVNRQYQSVYQRLPDQLNAISAPDEFPAEAVDHTVLSSAYAHASFDYRTPRLPHEEGFHAGGTHFFPVLRRAAGRHGSTVNIQVMAATLDGHLFALNPLNGKELKFNPDSVTRWDNGEPQATLVTPEPGGLHITHTGGSTWMPLPEPVTRQIQALLRGPGVHHTLARQHGLTGADYATCQDPHFRVGKFHGAHLPDHLYVAGRPTGYYCVRSRSPHATAPREELVSTAIRVLHSGKPSALTTPDGDIVINGFAAAMILKVNETLTAGQGAPPAPTPGPTLPY